MNAQRSQALIHIYRQSEQEKTVMAQNITTSQNKLEQLHHNSTDISVLAPLSKVYRWVLIGATIGSLLFTATYTIEGMTRPGYNAMQQAISALSLGPGGWMQQVNFMLFGLLTCCTAIIWRAILAHGVGERLVPFFHFLSGLTMIICGIFSQDAAPGYPVGAVLTVTVHGMIHSISSVFSIVSLIAICILLAIRFAREPQWRIWSLYAILTALLICVFMAGFGMSMAHNPQTGLFVGPAGLFERLAISSYSVYHIPVIIRLLRSTGRVSTTR